MKYLIVILCLLLSACFQQKSPETSQQTSTEQTAQNNDNSALIDAYKNKKSDIFVEGSGIVKKLLPDDNKGSRHQNFLVTVNAEQTLLFAHNIDLAPRLENLQVGDAITFRGEYVYNPKGGIMHWTHHDADGGNKTGWIKHNGKTYE